MLAYDRLFGQEAYVKRYLSGEDGYSASAHWIQNKNKISEDIDASIKVTKFGILLFSSEYSASHKVFLRYLNEISSMNTENQLTEILVKRDSMYLCQLLRFMPIS